MNEPIAKDLAATESVALRAREVLLTLLLFTLFAGWTPPHVNESHYLCKAQHYWNPSWCQGDHFLESSDAHLVFYWSFGWLTCFLPLTAVAWIGRILNWTLLAWAWCRLSRSITPRPMLAPLLAGLMLVFTTHFHMAGEWLVGGVEAKGFAYALVLLGIGAIVNAKWNRAWILLGAAAAFHVLVGGWAVIAAGVAWILDKKDRPSVVSMLPALVAGGLLSLLGLIPILMIGRGIDGETVRQANLIYVFERLSHHLVLTRFDHNYIYRFIGLVIAWQFLGRRFLNCPSSRRLRLFVNGTLVISACGAAITGLTLNDPDLAAKLLRFYWYRLSDIAVPIGVVIALGVACERLRKTDMAGVRRSIVIAWIVVGAVVGGKLLARTSDFRAAADKKTLHYDQWLDVCHWIAENTEPTDRFLTHPIQQTFRWHAGRSEVVNWKDVPQDAAALVQWWERLEDVERAGMAVPKRSEKMSPPLSESVIEELAKKYDFQYVVVNRRATRGDLEFEQVFPPPGEPDRWFTVYRIPDDQ